MKRVIPITAIIIILIGCSGSIHSGTTIINSEIERSLRDEINSIKENFINSVQDGDIENLKKLLSTNLLESDGFNLKNYVDQISPVLKNYNFIPKNEYLTKMKFKGNSRITTIIPEFGEDKLIINNLYFYNNESYNAFYLSEESGRDILLFLSLSKYNKEWKIDMIHLGNYGIKGQNPPELYRSAMELQKINRPLSALFYAMPINNYLRPVSFLQYRDESKYANFVNKSINEINEQVSFPVFISGIEIFGFNYEITDKEGIIPVILYRTNTELSQDSLEREVDEIEDDIATFTNNLRNDFPVIAMRAFNEFPVDKNTEYKNYTILVGSD